LMLPRLGGDQLVEAMRARAELAELPVLVLSARGDEALRTRLLTDAVQDYVTKPFSAQELRARVRNLAGRSTPATSSSASWRCRAAT
ncbi:MAG TPA: response regulator, partial [Burkholderiaceae bacterium]|nr:response regulator [Burkholderiaceae bacterium]